jgi:hypothetical protein
MDRPAPCIVQDRDNSSQERRQAPRPGVLACTHKGEVA